MVKSPRLEWSAWSARGALPACPSPSPLGFYQVVSSLPYKWRIHSGFGLRKSSEDLTFPAFHVTTMPASGLSLDWAEFKCAAWSLLASCLPCEESVGCIRWSLFAFPCWDPVSLTSKWKPKPERLEVSRRPALFYPWDWEGKTAPLF